MDTIGTIREISRYTDYSRFGRRISPSTVGSKLSSISSAEVSGCWCPYALIVILVIFVIGSLVASNFSIYFLMKDNCHVTMEKLNEQQQRHVVKPRENLHKPVSAFPELNPGDLQQHKLKRLLPNQQQPNLRSLLEPQNLDMMKSTTTFDNAATTLSVITRSDNTVSAKSVTMATAPIRPFYPGEKNVAGIFQLVATIRIPQQNELSPNTTEVGQPAAGHFDEDLFDLSKYFASKGQIKNDINDMKKSRKK